MKTDRHITPCVHCIQITNVILATMSSTGGSAMEKLWKSVIIQILLHEDLWKAHNVEVLQHWHIQTIYIYNCLLPLIYLCSILLQRTLLYEMYFKFYREGLSLKLHIIYISHISLPFRMILQTSLWRGKTDITVRNSLHKNITVKPNFCVVLFTNMCQKWKRCFYFWLS